MRPEQYGRRPDGSAIEGRRSPGTSPDYPLMDNQKINITSASMTVKNHFCSLRATGRRLPLRAGSSFYSGARLNHGDCVLLL